MELSQGTPISIKLRTKVKQQGEVQGFYFDLEGQTVIIGDTLYVCYKEIQEGTGNEIPVTIKLVPNDHVQPVRAGETWMRLKFDYRERLKTSYRTPYGMIQIAIFTKELYVSSKDRPIGEKARIDYGLFMGPEKTGEHYLTLGFTT